AALDGIRNIVAHGYRWAPDEEVSLRISSGAYQFTSWNGVNHWAAGPAPPADAGAWVHLCGVYDGVNFSLYRNGALLAQQADAMGAIAGDAPWAMGGRASSEPPDANRFFSGLIDDVRVYSRALSPSEIQALAGAR